MKIKTMLTMTAALGMVAIITMVLIWSQTPRAELAAAGQAQTPIFPAKTAQSPRAMPGTQKTVSSMPALPETAVIADLVKATPPTVLQSNGGQSAVVPGSQAGGSGKPALADPVARVALAYVGMDPDAELYWAGAINNPNLPAQERQDLIEDLNEDGLSDPKHPSRQDLPVIMRRLYILDQLGAMDQVNADAMNEAYKDLVNLAQLASGTGGEAVR